ncbi:MAG TPA: NRDE family protein [Steroidobacteraceae bacterium]|nr:NRDE family protein [Steroidobacteraceae bacterium]
MCLLVLAWRCHARYRAVVAANRDEFHARPAAALAPWTDSPGLAGGRDLQAGGAWFAMDARQRFGIVTNFREFGRRRGSAPSRGALIPSFLSGEASPEEALRALETAAPAYAGFNLLLADRDSLWYASNRAEQFARELPPGIYALSNEFLDTPWPKLVRVRARFTELLSSGAAEEPESLTRQLLDMLADRETAPPESLPPGDLPAEWARKLSAPFVLDAEYGTRCSTILTADDFGTTLVERRFDAAGRVSGQTDYRFPCVTAARRN